MSEHIHDWEYFALDKAVRRACNDCRALEELDIEAMERQLQEAQAANKTLEGVVAARDALLADVLRAVPIEFNPVSNGPDEWRCPVCFVTIQAIYQPPGHLKPPPEVFPHSDRCVLTRISALFPERRS